MTDPSPALTACPASAELHALLDGDADPAVSVHADVCPKCRSNLQTYRRIDAAIKNTLQPAPDLAARIQAACRSVPERSVMRWFWPQLAWRYAAAAAIVLAAASVWVVHVRSGAGQADQTAAIPPQPSQPTATQPAEGPTGQPVLDRDVALVGQFAGPGSGGPEGRRVPSIMPTRVRHVWVVPNLAESQKIFVNNLPAGSSHAALSHDPETLSFQVMLSDRDLQGLVDQLAAAGWALMSPTGPQPQRTQSLIATGRRLCYEVEFVNSR